MSATLEQAGKLIELVSKSGRPREWVQEQLFGSGILTEIFATDDLRRVDRKGLRLCLDYLGKVIVATVNGIVPPKSGEVQSFRLFVDESRPWMEFVRMAGPDTLKEQLVIIREFGDLNPPRFNIVPKMQEIFLANFGHDIERKLIIRWSKEQQLRPATPRECLTLGECLPQLHHHLGFKSVAVHALTPALVRGSHVHIYVYWIDEIRQVCIDWNDSSFGEPYEWFAFLKTAEQETSK